MNPALKRLTEEGPRPRQSRPRKLAAEDVRMARELAAQGYSRSRLAAALGVSIPSISKALDGRTYQWVK